MGMAVEMNPGEGKPPSEAKHFVLKFGCVKKALRKVLACGFVITILRLKFFDQRAKLASFAYQALHKLLEAIFGLAGANHQSIDRQKSSRKCVHFMYAGINGITAS